MRQAQTLTDAQLRRVLHYCRSRRYPLRDETIILTSFYAGLRAIEIAALKYADVFDAQGAVRDQFTLRATQSKGAGHALCTLEANSSAPSKNTKPVSSGTEKICHFLPVKKVATSQQTPCASCSSISTKPVVSEMHPVIQGGAPTSPSLPTKVWEYGYWQNLRGIRIYLPHSDTLM